MNQESKHDLLFRPFGKLVDVLIKEFTTQSNNNNKGFCELLFGNTPSQQSVNIRMGHVTEKGFNAWIPEEYKLPNTDHIVVGKKGASKRKQLDLIFKKGETVYYFECKNNIDLDTEKMPATLQKIEAVKKSLQAKFPNCKIIGKILASKYCTKEHIEKKYFKNGLTEESIIGYSELSFILHGVELNAYEWNKFWSDCGTRIKKQLWND
jgi:hypothetical protein